MWTRIFFYTDKKDAFSKRSGYVWTGPKMLNDLLLLFYGLSEARLVIVHFMGELTENANCKSVGVGATQLILSKSIDVASLFSVPENLRKRLQPSAIRIRSIYVW